MDFVAAGEATVISWELLTIFHQYGEYLWAVGAFLTITYKMYRYKSDSVSCPYTHIMSVINRLMSVKHAIVRIISQFSGGLVAYRYENNNGLYFCVKIRL